MRREQFLYQPSTLPAHHPSFTLGPSQALYTGLLYVLAQQIAVSLVTPLVQQHTVALPPALVMLAVVAFGLLCGLPGVLLAIPWLCSGKGEAMARGED